MSSTIFESNFLSMPLVSLLIIRTIEALTVTKIFDTLSSHETACHEVTRGKRSLYVARSKYQ